MPMKYKIGIPPEQRRIQNRIDIILEQAFSPLNPSPLYNPSNCDCVFFLVLGASSPSSSGSFLNYIEKFLSHNLNKNVRIILRRSLLLDRKGLINIKKQIALPVCIYQAGVKPGWKSVSLTWPVHPNIAKAIGLKTSYEVNNWTIPRFINSRMKIYRN